MLKFVKIISLINTITVLTGLFASCAVPPETADVQTIPIVYESAVQADVESDDYYSYMPNAVKINLDDGQPQTITASGAYRFSGKLENGCIAVNIDKNHDKGTVFIILDNADIFSSSTPINIIEAKKAVIVLEENSVNTITQSGVGESVAEDFPSAALFSKADLTVSGAGSLEIITDYNDGLNSRDDLKITGGIITINAPGDGIVGKDSVSAENCSITITAGKDGIRSTNTEDNTKGYTAIYSGIFNITSQDDCIQSQTSLYIKDGSCNLTSGGGFNGITGTANERMPGFGGKRPGGGERMPQNGENFSPRGKREFPTEGEIPSRELPEERMPRGNEDFMPPEGMENMISTGNTEDETLSANAINSEGSIHISGGMFNISASHDGINAAGKIVIDGGKLMVSAGDDAVHSDASLTAESCDVTVINSYEGLEAPYIAINSGNFNITSSDDGINVNGSGGDFVLNDGGITISAGGDGIDSNGKIILNGGNTVIDTKAVGPADTPIDYQTGFENNGGTVTDFEGNSVALSNMPGMGMGRARGK